MRTTSKLIIAIVLTGALTAFAFQPEIDKGTNRPQAALPAGKVAGRFQPVFCWDQLYAMDTTNGQVWSYNYAEKRWDRTRRPIAE